MAGELNGTPTSAAALPVDEQLRLVEGLARTMKEFRLDAVHVGDVKLVRTQHEPLPAPARPKDGAEDDDEDLYRST